MQDVILLVSISAIFIFGYFLMKNWMFFWKTIGIDKKLL